MSETGRPTSLYHQLLSSLAYELDSKLRTDHDCVSPDRAPFSTFGKSGVTVSPERVVSSNPVSPERVMSSTPVSPESVFSSSPVLPAPQVPPPEPPTPQPNVETSIQRSSTGSNMYVPEPCTSSVQIPPPALARAQAKPAANNNAGGSMSGLQRLMLTHPIWLLPNMSRAGAVHLLQSRNTGTFLVRQSSQVHTMALSVRMRSDYAVPVDHYLIHETNTGVRLEGSRHVFPSIPRMICHYSDHLDELPCRLRLPTALMQCTTSQQLTSLAILGQDYWSSPVSGGVKPVAVTRPYSKHSDVTANSNTPERVSQSRFYLSSPDQPACQSNVPKHSSSQFYVDRQDSIETEDSKDIVTTRRSTKRSRSGSHKRNGVLLSTKNEVDSNFNSKSETIPFQCLAGVDRPYENSSVVANSIDKPDSKSSDAQEVSVQEQNFITDEVEMRRTVEASPAYREPADVYRFSESVKFRGSSDPTYHSPHVSLAHPIPRLAKLASPDPSEGSMQQSWHSASDQLLEDTRHESGICVASPPEYSREAKVSSAPGCVSSPDAGVFMTPPEVASLNRHLTVTSPTDLTVNVRSSNDIVCSSTPQQTVIFTNQQDVETVIINQSDSPHKDNNQSRTSSITANQSQPLSITFDQSKLSRSDSATQTLDSRWSSDECLDSDDLVGDVSGDVRDELQQRLECHVSKLQQVASDARSEYDNLDSDSVFVQTRGLRQSGVSHCSSLTEYNKPWDSSAWRNILSPMPVTPTHVESARSASRFYLPSTREDTLQKSDYDTLGSAKQHTHSQSSADSFDESHLLILHTADPSSSDEEVQAGDNSVDARDSDPATCIKLFICNMSRDHNTTFGSTILNFIQCTREGSEKNPHIVMRNIRQFMSGIRNYLLKHGEKSLTEFIQKQRPKLSSDEFLNIDSLTELALQKCVIRPLRAHIYRLLIAHYNQNSSLQELKENIKFSLDKSSVELGVCGAVPTTEQLQQIKLNLKRMQRAYSPIRKQQHLLSAVRTIYSHMRGARRKSAPGADQLLPLLVYIVSRCQLFSAEIECSYMSSLLLVRGSSSEGSYYLTALTAAVHLLKGLRHSTELLPASVSSLDSSKASILGEMNGFIKVLVPDEENDSIRSKALPIRPDMSAKDLVLLVCHELGVGSTVDYGLYIIRNGEETVLADTDKPQMLRQTGRSPVFAFKRREAKYIWPKSLDT